MDRSLCGQCGLPLLDTDFPRFACSICPDWLACAACVRANDDPIVQGNARSRKTAAEQFHDLHPYSHCLLAVPLPLQQRQTVDASVQSCALSLPMLYHPAWNPVALPGSTASATLAIRTKEMHSAILCDGCSHPIVGTRYMCLHEHDFDLCSQCFWAQHQSDDEHCQSRACFETHDAGVHVMLRATKALPDRVCRPPIELPDPEKLFGSDAVDRARRRGTLVLSTQEFDERIGIRAPGTRLSIVDTLQPATTRTTLNHLGLRSNQRMPNLQLRIAVEDDVRTLAALERDAFAEPYDAEYLYQLVDSRSINILVAMTGQDAVLGGYVAYYLSQRHDRGTIMSLAVGPANRGMGIGRVLLEAAVADLERHVTTTVLHVNASNRNAISLYLSTGFEPDVWLDRYYPADEFPAALIMVRNNRKRSVTEANHSTIDS